MEPFLRSLRTRLAPAGLNLIGATSVAAYDAVAPPGWRLGAEHAGVRAIVVIGNGGRAFWDAFTRDGSRAGMRDPLDAFTRATVEAAVAPLAPDVGGVVRVVYPFDVRPPRLSFVHLGRCAGLGAPSRLGMLVHPEFGPWMALRAALLLPVVMEAPRPAARFDPCPACTDRPCETACPAGAVTARGWDIPVCAAHRLAERGDACGGGCQARIACVLGVAHRHPPEALAFHQASARAAMSGAGGG